MFRRWLSWWWKFKLEMLNTRKLFSFHRLISFRISESLFSSIQIFCCKNLATVGISIPTAKSDINHVSQHLPERIPLYFVLNRFETITDLGFKGPEWSHQENHRSRYSKFRLGNHGNKRFDELYYVPGRPKANVGH